MDLDKLSDDELRQMAANKIKAAPKPKDDLDHLSDDELRSMATKKMTAQDPNKNPSMYDAAISAGMKNPMTAPLAAALNPAFHRGLKAVGDTVSTGLAGLAGLVTGKGPAPKDYDAAYVGKGLTGGELLEKGGVPEGPSVDLPVAGKVSARDVGGFLAKTAVDPTLYGLEKAGAAPVSKALESGGRSMYKSGLKKVDERLEEKGASPLSDLLLQEGKSGSTKTLAKDTEVIGQQALSDRSLLYEQVKKTGQKVDVGGIANNAKAKLAKMAEDPGLRPTADRLQEMLDRYTAEGFVDIDKASDWKSNLYNALPDAAYEAHGKLRGPVAQFQKALAADFRKGILEAAEKAEPGLGGKIDALNERMQTTITAKKPMAMQVRRGETPNVLTAVDAMLAGSGALHSPAAGVGLLALKKAADLSKTTYARTKVGRGLINAGKSGIPQGLVTEGLLQREGR